MVPKMSEPPNKSDLSNSAPQETRSIHPNQQREATGSKVGPFVLLQKIGEGGMGTVWVAEQTRPVKRRVALKLIRADLRSSETMRRFEAERQALALMDHNNIAKVLDAGETSGGIPYFAMEFIKGIPITKYCDEMRVDMRERLRLFVQVCDAVQHAHQKGIIHRDLKPSNILVAMQDGVPTPKIIDFGVAKALHQKLSDKTMYTEIGQMIGTLEYMSPEQAELSALDVDTRADIYSLGVILYELCTGSTPISSERIRSAGILGAIRLIKEDEPMRPSTRLSQTHSSLRNASNSRREDPRRLVAQLRGEVDWIILKTLEKDRTRRYDSAIGLGNDIRRFLNNEPVQARPASTAYLIKKLVHRHRAIAIGVLCCFSVLILGVIGTTYGLISAEQARKEAVKQREVAIEQKQAAEKQQTIAIEQQNLAITAKEDAERQKSQVIEQNSKISDLNSRMRSLLDSFISQNMIDMLARQASLDAGQKGVLNSILQQYEQIIESDDNENQSNYELALMYDRIGAMHQRIKNYKASRVALEKAIETWRRMISVAPNDQDSKVRLAVSLMSYGIALQFERMPVEAEKSFLESAALYESLLDFRNGDTVLMRRHSQVLSNLANHYSSRSELHKCLEIQLKCIEANRQIVELEPNNFDFQDALGWCLWASVSNLNKRSEFSRSEELAREAVEIFRTLVQKSPQTSLYRSNLTRSLNALGETLYYRESYDEAERVFQESIPHSRLLISKYPGVVEHRSRMCDDLAYLGHLALRKGDQDEVQLRVDEGVSIITSIEDGAITHDVQHEMSNLVVKLGSLAIQANLHEQAYRLFSSAAKVVTSSSEKPTVSVWMAYCLVRMDRIDDALREMPELAELDSQPADVIYNAACVYSVAFKKRPEDSSLRSFAESFLIRSIQRGYSELTNIPSDPDLEAIRDGDSFRLWVLEYPQLSKLIEEGSFRTAAEIIKRLERDETPAFGLFLCLHLAVIAKLESNEELTAYVRTKLMRTFPAVKNDFGCDRALKCGLLIGMNPKSTDLARFATQLEEKLETPTWGAYYALSASWAQLVQGDYAAAIEIASKRYPNEKTALRLSKDWVAVQALDAIGNVAEAKRLREQTLKTKTEFQTSLKTENLIDLDWLFFSAMTK